MGGFKLTFPLYAVAWIDNTHFVVGGGGGASKTGVPNRLVLVEVGREHDECVVRSIHDVGNEAIRSISRSRRLVASLAGNTVTLVEVSSHGLADVHCLTIDSTPDVFQRVVYMDTDGVCMVVGSEEGAVRLYHLQPQWKWIRSLEGHTDQVNDVHINSLGTLVATTSLDGYCIVWDRLKGTPIMRLPPHPPHSKATFRGCQFTVDGKYLITAQTVPEGAMRYAGYLTKWEVDGWACKKSVLCIRMPITRFTMSPNGKYLALGTGDGAVAFFFTDSLSQLAVIQVHDFVVTDIAFSPDSHRVVSTSANSTAACIRVPAWEGMGSFLVLIAFTFGLVALYVMLVMGGHI